MMTASFGVTPRVGPLWRKIEGIAAARELASAEVVRAERERIAKARRREARALLIGHRQAVQPAVPTVPMRPWQAILAEVAIEHGMTIEELLCPCRSRAFTRPRFKAAWRLYSETALSLPQIGKRMGGRDHTSILNAIERYMEESGITDLPAHRSRQSHYLGGQAARRQRQASAREAAT